VNPKVQQHVQRTVWSQHGILDVEHLAQYAAISRDQTAYWIMYLLGTGQITLDAKRNRLIVKRGAVGNLP